MTRRILVTSALPYANGAIHIGHLLEHVQSDSWVRFMRMRGHEAHFVCADDAHGTPVMIAAEQQGARPEELIGRMQREHEEDLAHFGVAYDCYHTTHSDENRELATGIYGRLREAGRIAKRSVAQLYDPQQKQFLADRYIRGDCPRCGAPDQNGDNCEECGATYAATELGRPRSALSGAELEIRKSEHYFFELSACGDFLKDWLTTAAPGPGPGPRLQKQAENKLMEWFDGGLQDWDISRDAPYFGFEIPDAPGKYFYVWLDAPIGYLASFRRLCRENGVDFDAFLAPDTGTEMYHFIGKDIMYFHGLFWPAMLREAGHRTPTRLFIHGFLTVNGMKMSKSKGTFITAASYRRLGLDPDWLRYYMASKLNDRIEDVDLNLDEFIQRVNADLVGKIANIPSRVARLLAAQCGGKMAEPGAPLLDFDAEEVAALYEGRKFSEATRRIMAQAERVNQHMEREKPWELSRDPAQRDRLHRVCTDALNAFKDLLICLKPLMPRFAAAAEEYLACGPLAWSGLGQPLPAGHALGEFKHLMKRVGAKDMDRLLAANRSAPPPAAAPAEGAGAGLADVKDFAKLELRVAEVLEAAAVEGSDKLLRLRVSLGADGERVIFAGIKAHVDPASLAGRKIAVVANLKPRKMRFGTSEGMALAASGDGGVLAPLFVDDAVPAGGRIS